MKQFLQIIILLFIATASGQEAVVHSVYFSFDKFSLDEKQQNDILNFIQKTDTTRIASVQIFGYTDDIGKDAYNFKLSTNRANTIMFKLIEKGVKNKIIVTIEGKGRILIEDDVVDNLPELRSKNRRVDIVLNLKILPKIEIPGMFTSVQKNHVVGDHIYLENILFERGSSKLDYKSKSYLDKIIKILLKNKTLEFEIQGHICCTPSFHKEAIDLDSRKRLLSHNRAENVYKYLILKRIPKNRMTFKGYGNTVPLGKGSEYDRRVEFVITKV